MHRSRAAHDLLEQICFEKNADIVLISEQYRNRDGPGWFSDDLGTAAIWNRDPQNIHIAGHGGGSGFVWVRHQQTHYVSVYLTPNQTISDFQAKLEGLEDAAREMQGELIIAGDFNAKAPEWGEARSDRRGRLVMDMTSRLDLVVLNQGTTSTFRRPGCRETIIDVSLASERLAARIESWHVVEDYTGSDHMYITFRVRDSRPAPFPHKRGSPRWNITKIDSERLATAIEHGQRTLREIPESLPLSARAKMVTDCTMKVIEKACEEAVPRKRTRGSRRPAYWWTNEIADLRKTCLQLRRRTQRVKKRDVDAAPLAAEYKAAKKSLKKAIKPSRQRCWKELGEEMDNYPWGLGYKIVMRKLATFGSSAPKDALTMTNIVRALFPEHPRRPDRPATSGPFETPLFTNMELSIAIKSLRNKRAPGPDGLPAELLKAIGGSHPRLLLDMYNSCLKAGIFPARWKTARLVLISKGKGPADSPTAYRPLCMLDTAGKLLEKLLKPRLQAAISASGDLAPRQYGFRRGRSTIDAVQEVVNAARSTEQGNHYSRPICLLATLDVKNAFNSVRWDKALEAFERAFRIPAYLLRILGDYLRDRSITYDTEDGPIKREITSGAAQGSMLGPDIWNVFYDGILRMEMPEGTFLVGYADDIAVVIEARDVDLARLLLNRVMRRVFSWLEDRGLELATKKTEIVLLTKRHINTMCPFQVGDATVQAKSAVRYLGVSLDNKLTFREHLTIVTEKAAAVTSSLSRLMANTTGPRPCKRRLLMRAAEAVMLYGAEVWADALRKDVHRKRLAAVQRRAALRIACSYRTVSEPAILVVAGVIPIDLLALERRFVHQQKPALGVVEAHRTARANTIQAWQHRWESSTKGRWTARLIPQVDTWLFRKEGEVNYYLTQFLTGHGLFRAYLHKMGKVADPGCTYCEGLPDDVFHTFFVCGRWTVERGALERDLGCISPDNIVRLMLQGPQQWAKVASYVEVILRHKKTEENSRSAARRAP